MRFISKAQNFKKSVIKGKVAFITGPDGSQSQTETVTPYIAFFEQGGATPYEVKLALEKFQFKGLSEREDPARRISIYDTDEAARRENWDADFKERVEKSLLAGQGEFYFHVEAPKTAVPWANYDEFDDPSDIVETAKLIGVDFNHVIAYERENKNRPTVIAAFEVDSDPAEVEVSA